MRRIVLLVGLISIVLTIGHNNSIAQDRFNQQDNTPKHLIKYVPNKIYWQVEVGTPIPSYDREYDTGPSRVDKIIGLSDIVSNHRVTRIEKSFKHWRKNDRIGRTYTIHFEDNEGADNLLKALDRLPATNLSELIPLDELSFIPNDPKYALDQPYLADIQAEEAWDNEILEELEFCGGDIVIAIVDDAVLITHHDLVNNIWENEDEAAGDDGDDDDENEYFDDINGYDVADDDSDPSPPSPVDFPAFSHGTHVAGIAAATTNNAKGIASMGFNCKIMPIKATSNTGDPNFIPFGYAGILYAIASGADVINMSWGSYGSAETNKLIIEEAFNAGIVCVASAGNDYHNYAKFPARYSYVIGVGATAAYPNTSIKADWSNYGYGVDVMAPGTEIMSTVAQGSSNTKYDVLDGTSMASPLVAGLVGLYLCKYKDDDNLNPSTG